MTKLTRKIEELRRRLEDLEGKLVGEIETRKEKEREERTGKQKRKRDR